MDHTAVTRITSNDAHTASGTHKLRTRLLRADIALARSRTTLCVRFTSEARAPTLSEASDSATDRSSSPWLFSPNFSETSFIPSPPPPESDHSSISPTRASAKPAHGTTATLPSTTEPASYRQ